MRRLAAATVDLKAGTYALERGASWSTVLDALTRGKGLVHTVTIPEGFALSSIAPLLGRALSVPPESVMAAASDSALRHRLDVPTPTLEGYLFPDTYTFAEGTSPRRSRRHARRALRAGVEAGVDQPSSGARDVAS